MSTAKANGSPVLAKWIRRALAAALFIRVFVIARDRGTNSPKVFCR